MRIKSYKCSRFAGLKDIDLEFKPGINVILGPNESGKSTIVNGIHSTLFKNTKLKKNNKSDKEFEFKFMPKPSGDFIDGKVTIESAKGEYEISKEWGSSIDLKLLSPDGSIVKDKDNIEKILNEVLIHGESTYSNIVFAKQRDLKRALNNIIENRQINKEINDLLRKSLMELDGISIDTIENNIETQIENLYKRWDKDKNYPENNRGVNNKYKVGLGQIIESYYNREDLRIQMEDADKFEREFDQVVDCLKDIKEKKEVAQEKKKTLEKIEEDVNKRQVLESRIESIEKDLKILKDTNTNWPKSEMRLEQLEEKLKKVKEEKEKLDNEKKDIEMWNKKKKLEEKLKSIEKIEEDKKTTGEKIDNIPNINKKDIEDLNKIKRDLSTIETTMKAGKMIGILKKSNNKDIYISKDFEKEEKLEVNSEFYANGLVNIRYADEFEIQIKTGEIDFEELNRKSIALKEEYNQRLEELNVESLEKAKVNLAKIEELEGEIRELDNKLSYILEYNRKEELEKEFNNMKDIKEVRALDEIEKDLNKIREDELEFSSDIKVEKDKIKSWQEKYETKDKLFDEVIEKHGEIKLEREKLQSLKPLPKEYESSEDFKEDLKDTRKSLEDYQREYEDLREKYHNTKANLTDISYEELKKEYNEAEKTFEKNIKRGEKLLKIRKVFLQTKDSFSKDPMEPLVDEFTRLLELVTNGSYNTCEIDEEFNIKIENIDGDMPIELLSAGTYDAVTLALRFSLLKHIFDEKQGYVILDDCLVDLDPMRKRQSIDLINDFAKDYQIIFTTCDPETANMLGGNIIEL